MLFGNLHWLLVRIKYKLCLLAYKAVVGHAPGTLPTYWRLSQKSPLGLHSERLLMTTSRFAVQDWQISAAADRPARRSDSCPPCCTQTSTVIVTNWWPRPSSVYHTDRPPKLTAPETISRSRDMVGAAVPGDYIVQSSSYSRWPESILYSTANKPARNEVGFRAWLRRQPDGTEWAEYYWTKTTLLYIQGQLIYSTWSWKSFMSLLSWPLRLHQCQRSWHLTSSSFMLAAFNNRTVSSALCKLSISSYGAL